MAEYFTTEDIYYKEILLLSKGQKITDTVLTKLKSLGTYQPEELVDFDNRQRAVLAPISEKFKAKMNIHDDCILERPNKILNTIIFESKTKPWWIYVNALANYVDWLYTHSIDVALISLMIAENLGCSDEELLEIGLGAFLHDVGELLVPKPILQKPGPLNNVEMDSIRQHCELGKSSLQPYGVSKEGLDIILQHHERLDGSGYPEGLKDDEICRGAKIVMIADAVDAITSGRPYKQPTQEMKDAITILRNDEGKYHPEYLTWLENILQ